jgi:transposase InsO family protein
MCYLLGVSRSGYYRWQGHRVSKRQQENDLLVTEIRKIHQAVTESYGSPRMTVELHARGYNCGHNRVARLMRDNEIIARRTIRFRRLTKAGKRPAKAPNILARQFAVATADSVWASDITYIPTAEGFLYLAVVLDLYSRRVVGWGMSSRLNPELVVSALYQALQRRGVPSGLLHHSDQDVLYSSGPYQRLLSDNGITCSMSGKGNCYDNACVESFFGSLKNEFTHFVKFESRDQAALELFNWIEVFYNRVRRHSTLNYLCPVDYEQKKW